METHAQSMADREQCTQCGTPLETGALAGLCPACLLRQGAAADTASAGPGPAFAAPAVAELAPLFPQLEIQALVGKGGMGAVYKARQPALDRWVALKLLPARAEGGAAAAERFSREARALARLTHPHIVGIYEYGTVAGYHYFLMELVDGVNLRQLQKNGRLSAREALQIVPQICDALQYAHDEGIVHRDIKPENVLLDRRGRVKIADFGLAKLQDAPPAELRLTAEGQVMGTPHYMAPEQVEHPHEVDHRADIFSLGVVFYELLTGELPLGKFPPPSRRVAVDVRLDQVVLRTLEKQPELRYQRAGEVRTAVETIASDTGKTTPARRPRLSALAVIGAAWAPFFFLTLTALYGWSADRGFDEIALSFLSLQPKFEIGVVLNWLSLLAPFGVTILGWLAISQIRRSQGCLYGLPLALVDGLLFPLLALDAIICGWWPPASTIQRTLVNSDAPSPTFLGMKALTDPTILASPESNDVPSPTIWGVKVLAAVALDALLYWLAWRALARPVFATPKTQTPVIPTNPSRRHFAPLSLGLFLLGSLGTLFLMAVSVHHDMALFFGVLALVLALVFGALSWQERLGKWVARITMAVLVGSLFSLAWLSGLIPYPGRAARKAELGAQALAAVAQQQVETQKAENARRQAARPAETRGISPPDFIQAETDLAALEVFGDRLETALQSGNRALAEKLMEQFVEQLLLLKRSVANTEVEFPTNRLVLTLKARDAIKAGDLAMAGTLFEAAMATTASDDDYPERIAALAGKQREARGMPFVLGPVIECELHSVWSGANCVLNVETGQTLPLPHAILETIPSQIVQQRALWAVLPRNKSGELWQWLISVNADLLCGEGPNNLFWLRGFVLGQTLDPSKPTKVLTAIEKFRLEARDYLAAAATNDIYNDAQLSVPLPPDAGDNYWVLFKTRKNRYGIIQVVEPLKNPPGVKIRYRLVQEAPAGQGEAKVNTAGKAPALAYQWFRTNAAVAPVNQVAPAESAQLKLKLAELDLTGMEKKYQAGFVTQYDRDVARFLRDIAAAELRQDPLETARLHLQLLDLHLKVAEAKQKVGLTNLAECERLRAIRDAAAAELQRMETNR